MYASQGIKRHEKIPQGIVSAKETLGPARKEPKKNHLFNSLVVGSLALTSPVHKTSSLSES